jgi:4-hydroxy-tetrahydrodipicolinate synthase
VPAVPVPWTRDSGLDEAALAGYVRWMARQPIAGVAVSVHTGRGRHLAPADRRRVLAAWREGLPDRVVVAGAWDEATAAEAREGGADAVLAFPCKDDPLRHHERLSRHLPVILFYLYEAAGGVAWPLTTLRELLAQPGVLGIKVATLDSVMTFQDIAALVGELPDKLLILTAARGGGRTHRDGGGLDRHSGRVAPKPGRPRLGSLRPAHGALR